MSSLQGRALIGRPIRVWWEHDRSWFRGTVRDFDNVSGQHLVVYDDGDQLWEPLDDDKACRWTPCGDGRPSTKAPPSLARTATATSKATSTVTSSITSGALPAMSPASADTMPPTAVNLYVAERKAAIRLEHPTLSGLQVQQLALVQWRSENYDQQRKQELRETQATLRRAWIDARRREKGSSRSRAAMPEAHLDQPMVDEIGRRERTPTAKARHNLNAAATDPRRGGPFTCRDCGASCPSTFALGGHRRVCSSRTAPPRAVYAEHH